MNSAVMHTRVLIVAALVVAAAAAAATPVPHADTALSPLAFLLPAPPLAARPAGARALPARRARAPHETQHYEPETPALTDGFGADAGAEGVGGACGGN